MGEANLLLIWVGLVAVGGRGALSNAPGNAGDGADTGASQVGVEGPGWCGLNVARGWMTWTSLL
jgi:hypothetical protein